MARILIVEDDVKLAGVIEDWLLEDQHQVTTAVNGPKGLELARSQKFDILILDWNLPGLDGIDVCKQYRTTGGTAAVLMLTGRQEVQDKEAGLDAGADDYVTKPFHMREIGARVRALLRRSRTINESVIQIGKLTLDTVSCEVTRAGEAIKLMPKEFALLEFFMRQPGKVFSQDELLDNIWGKEQEVPPDTVRVHIAKLRNKIDEQGMDSIIKTIHRVGYKLEAPL